jgi:serine/threonine-protein kinase ULK/ATG1
MEVEYNAVICVMVYMLLMSFLQKGIDKLRNHQEHMKMCHPDADFVVSEGFHDGGYSLLLSFVWPRCRLADVFFLVALLWLKGPLY